MRLKHLAGLAGLSFLVLAGPAGAAPSGRGEPALPPGTVAEALNDGDVLFQCSGSIMHQRLDDALASPLAFWFRIPRGGNRLDGMVTSVGAPLNLPSQPLSGQFDARYDRKGVFTGGEMLIDWPFAQSGQTVDLAVMRETFVRTGLRTQNGGELVQRASEHTYVAGVVRFDSAAHPSLSRVNRLAFIAATCLPQTGLPVADAGARR